jgi:hypothetical protein
VFLKPSITTTFRSPVDAVIFPTIGHLGLLLAEAARYGQSPAAA